MNVKLFNTLSREIEAFHPIDSNEVKLYCCGPTVYNYQHIGNLRTYIFEDLLARVLRFAGYRVKHVMNITDVGHLASDADEGEDKMALASRREGKSSLEIADYYTKIFFQHCAELNLARPDVVCKATDHIEEMIALIQELEAKGIAYCSGGNVYFDVSQYEAYPELAKLDLESLCAGARVGVDHMKRSPLDFALWFTRSKFENQELQWDSPWGRGYPGWHIECSAMAMKYLGPEIDIHCGGIDHIPVHHTNERAQSECATGKTFARFWMHGGFLVTDKKKMSKSTGEFLTLDKLKEKGIDPLAYKLMCYSGSYRGELAWSFEAVQAAESRLKRLRKQIYQLRSNPGTGEHLANAYENDFREALFHDLGTSKALAVLHALIDDQGIKTQEKLRLVDEWESVLCLGLNSWVPSDIPEAIQELVDKRASARKNKNWKEADDLRDELLSLGYEVEDTPDGTKVERR